MTVKELLDVIDRNRDCDSQIIQVCVRSKDWEDFEVLHTNGTLIDAIADKRIKCMGAIGEDVFRIDIDWAD